jgi:hypothetical protein
MTFLLVVLVVLVVMTCFCYDFCCLMFVLVVGFVMTL